MRQLFNIRDFGSYLTLLLYCVFDSMEFFSLGIVCKQCKAVENRPHNSTNPTL